MLWIGQKALDRRSSRRWDCCWADRLALDMAHLCKKNHKEEGPAGASPVAALMP